MYAVAVSLILTLVLTSSDAQQQKDCSGGYVNGEEVVRDPYWYRCEYGRLEPQGCLTDVQAKIKTGESFNSRGYEHTCVMDSNRFLSLKMTACLHKNQRVAPSQLLSLGESYFQCHDKGHYLVGEIMGCVVDGRRVPLGQRLEKDDQFWECQMNSLASAGLRVLGCVHDGRQRTIGEQYTDEKFIYSCNMKGKNACKRQTLGCVHSGRKMYDQQTYHENDQIYRCSVKPDRSGAEHVVEGCVTYDPYNPASPIEKTFGCQWPEGLESNRYLVECVEREGQAVKNRFRCMYSGSQGYTDVLPGCYVQLKDIFVGCKRGQQAGDLQIETFTESHSADLHGLTNDPYYCSIFTGLYLTH